MCVLVCVYVCVHVSVYRYVCACVCVCMCTMPITVILEAEGHVAFSVVFHFSLASNGQKVPYTLAAGMC
jgi:hypothetical protein